MSVGTKALKAGGAGMLLAGLCTAIAVAAYVPGAASAQGPSVSELRAQVEELTAEVERLRARLLELQASKGIETVKEAENEFSQRVFTRDMALGSRGEDVRRMQEVLNRDPATRLTAAGAGSPGLETEYFGPLTRNAVVRFQEKYREMVLAPLGLSVGTGYAGPLTRAKLTLIAFSSEGEGSSESAAAPVLASLSPSSGGAGTTITVSGEHFAEADNTVYVGFNAYENVSSADGKTLSITLDDRARSAILPGLDTLSGEQLGILKKNFPSSTLVFGVVVVTPEGRSNELQFHIEPFATSTAP